ncbi:tyrosine-type recombinase/integrase [Hyphococcus sp.]|uniref:tyrosine-type recombinase/integrase n=1 Tax=Hyphococcus sp. TaxID=2038636 RepID=UPI0035C6BC50
MPNIYPDLSIRANRRKLASRPRYPYFQTLTGGRAIGFDKRTKNEGYWIARFRTTDGKYRRHRLGKADTQQRADGKTILSFEHAVELAQAWFDRPENASRACKTYKLGPTTEVAYTSKPGEFTVGDAMLEWAAWKRLRSTQAHYLSLINRVNYHIIARLGDFPAEQMNGEVLRKFVTEIMALPAKRGKHLQEPARPIESYDEETIRKRKKTINTLISYLKCALEMAWENGRIDNDRTFRCMKHLRTADRPRTLHLSRDECRMLLDECPADLKQLILGALYTGCRFAELTNLRASHVGRDGYGIYVEPRKSFKARFVFLPDEGMAFFLSLIKNKAPGEYVFTRTDGKKWKYNLRYPLKSALKRAKLPKEFCFHGLRHTYASQLVQSGAPLIVVADQLGHANTNTVSQTYGHLSPQIRESEVRQRFTTVDGFYARKAKRDKKKMSDWRASLHGGDWRGYASIHDVSASSNTRH